LIDIFAFAFIRLMLPFSSSPIMRSIFLSSYLILLFQGWLHLKQGHYHLGVRTYVELRTMIEDVPIFFY
jgi:hypothetical protein